MIICLCTGTSDKTIHSLIDQGVRNFRAMRIRCDIGKGCGKCIEVVKKIIDEKTGFSCDDSYANKTSESRALKPKV